MIAGASCSGRCGRAPVPGLATKDVGTLVDVIATSSRALPRQEFDPAALVESVGRDPQKLFAWVRDHTWWAPYRGLLRGPVGVMLDRLGSHLDRAVLLGDLVRRTGVPVRLARAQLPDTEAHRLLGRVRAIPNRRTSPRPVPPVSSESQAVVETILPGYGKTTTAARAMAEARWNDGTSLLRAQSAQLIASLQGLGVASEDPDAIAAHAMADHWWVEYHDGGRWIALDVLLPDSQAGQVTTPAAQTFEWNPATNVPPVPGNDWHTVQMRVIVERSRSGARSEGIALETTIHPTDALEHPITLAHMPGSSSASPTETVDVQSLRRAALDTRRWIPVVSIGHRLIATAGFETTGEILAEPLADTPPSAAGGLLGGFDGGLGGGDEDPGSASAEWLELEIHTPGRPDRTVRRPVFDLLGPARRAANASFDGSPEDVRLARAEALAAPIDIFVQSCDLTDEYVTCLESASLLAQQDALHDLARQRDPAATARLAREIYQRLDVWSPLLDVAQARSALDGSTGIVVDRANVLTYRVTQRLDSTNAVQTELIDIATNGVGVSSGTADAAFGRRVTQGVADTIAEVLALGLDPRSAANTASLFAMNAQTSGWTVVKPTDSDAVRALEWPDDAAARLTNDVNEGFAAIALTRPVDLGGRPRLGWWRVDPASGETIGVMDTGFHQAMPENSAIREKVAQLQQWLSRTQQVARGPMTGRNAEALKRLIDQRQYVASVIREVYRAGYMGL